MQSPSDTFTIPTQPDDCFSSLLIRVVKDLQPQTLVEPLQLVAILRSEQPPDPLVQQVQHSLFRQVHVLRVVSRERECEQGIGSRSDTSRMSVRSPRRFGSHEGDPIAVTAAGVWPPSVGPRIRYDRLIDAVVR